MKNTLYSWFSILIGCIILAAGFVFFINPYNIVPGGMEPVSYFHNLFPSIQVGTFGYMFDIPLLILSVVLLGAKLGCTYDCCRTHYPFTDEYHIQTSLSYQRSIGSTQSSPACRWKYELI